MSFVGLFNSGGPFMFQSLGVAHSRLAEQFLKFPPVVERPLYVRHEFVGNIDGESFPFHPHIQKMTGMFLPFQAGGEFAPTQTAQREQQPRVLPQLFQPTRDINAFAPGPAVPIYCLRRARR